MEVKLFLLSLFVISFTYAQTGPYPIIDSRNCKESDTLGVFYLNGVRNDTEQAFYSSYEIENLINESSSLYIFNNNGGRSNICYKYLYNQTNGLFDFVEVIVEKVREASKDEDGNYSLTEDQVYARVAKYLFQRDSFFELYSDTPDVNGISRREIINQETLNAEVAFLNSIREIESETSNQIFNILKEELSKRSVTLVSHSQGNLIANEMSKKINESVELEERKSDYANLQIASTVNGLYIGSKDYSRYMTQDADVVIAGLSRVSSFGVLNSNFSNYFQSIVPDGPRVVPSGFFSDKLGHGFLEIYTNNDVKGAYNGFGLSYDQIGMRDLFRQHLSDLSKNITTKIIKDIVPIAYQQIGDNEGFLNLKLILDSNSTGKSIRVDYGVNRQAQIIPLSGTEKIIQIPVYVYTQIQELGSDGSILRTYNLSAPTVNQFSGVYNTVYYGYYESDSIYIKPHFEAEYDIFWGGVEGQKSYHGSYSTKGQKESAMLTLRAFCTKVNSTNEDGETETVYELRDEINDRFIDLDAGSCSDFYGVGDGKIVFLNQYGDEIGSEIIILEDKSATISR